MASTLEILITSDGGGGSVTAALEPMPQPSLDACCLWCGRTFPPRVTGGSAQKFCTTAHRQQFWIAARRWTMRAIEAGPTLGRLLEGVSRERARCVKGVPLPERSAEHRALLLAGCGKKGAFSQKMNKLS